MEICFCCKQNEIKPTFSFYCRWCYIYLQQRYGLHDTDYITYFKTMYHKKVIEKDCSHNSLFEIHNHYQYNLHLTDKPLAELLEVVLFVKVIAVNLENSFNFRVNM